MICDDCAAASDYVDLTGLAYFLGEELALLTEEQRLIISGHARCKGCTCQHRTFVVRESVLPG